MWQRLMMLFRVLQGRVRGEHFDSNGVRIHYTVQGEGEPVLLIHGITANADMNWRFSGIIQQLVKHYKVIAMDVRGHGFSDKPYTREAYGLESVNDAIRLLDHLGIQRAHFVGYSMGAIITLKLITLHPERVISAVAGGAGCLNCDEPTRAWIDNLHESIVSRGDFTPLVTRLDPKGQPPKWKIRLSNWLMPKFNDVKAIGYVAHGFHGLHVADEEMRNNTVPVLSIVGTCDPLKDGVERMTGVMGNHRAVLLDKCDHFTTVGNPGFVREMLAFLKANPASVAAPAPFPDSQV